MENPPVNFNGIETGILWELEWGEAIQGRDRRGGRRRHRPRGIFGASHKTIPEKPMEARTSISEVPDTGKEEKTNPRPPERAAEGGQVRFDDEKLIGMAFVMTGLSGA